MPERSESSQLSDFLGPKAHHITFSNDSHIKLLRIHLYCEVEGQYLADWDWVFERNELLGSGHLLIATVIQNSI